MNSKRIRKFLSVVLALIMVLGAMPTAAFAVESEELEALKVETKAELDELKSAAEAEINAMDWNADQKEDATKNCTEFYNIAVNGISEALTEADLEAVVNGFVADLARIGIVVGRYSVAEDLLKAKNNIAAAIQASDWSVSQKITAINKCNSLYDEAIAKIELAETEAEIKAVCKEYEDKIYAVYGTWLGDVNGDGKVDATDGAIVYGACNDNEVVLDDVQFSKADVNRDGKITVRDAMLIYDFANGAITNF